MKVTLYRKYAGSWFFTGGVRVVYDTAIAGASHGYTAPKDTSYIYKADATVKLTGTTTGEVSLSVKVFLYYTVTQNEYAASGERIFSGAYSSSTRTVSTGTMSVKDQLLHVRIIITLAGTYEMNDYGLSDGNFYDGDNKIELLTFRIYRYVSGPCRLC